MTALIDLFLGGVRTWILLFLGQSLCSRLVCRLMRSLPRARAFSSMISMMARSTTRSNLRPDTLMQDRRRQFDEIFLQRTAGPYIWVKRRRTHYEQMFSAVHPITDIPGLDRRKLLVRLEGCYPRSSEKDSNPEQTAAQVIALAHSFSELY